MSSQPSSRTQQLLRRFAGAQRSERTARTYGSIAEAFLAFVGRRRPEQRDVAAFLMRPLRCGRRASVSTYNQALAALRSFARFAVAAGTWSEDPTAGLSFLREPEREPPVLLVAEVHAFFRAVSSVSPPALRARDRAVLALLFVAGLRLSELVRLDVSQVDLVSATLVGVLRKGGRVQNIPIEPSAFGLVREWLEERATLARPSDPALFVSPRGGRVSGRSIERLFERIRRHVGTPKRATPHTARHSFITLDLAFGADITVVSRLAGHASIATTMRYRHLVDAEPRAAVARLGVVVPAELARPTPSASDGGESTMPAVVSTPWLDYVRPSNDTLDDQENLDDAASLSSESFVEEPLGKGGLAA